MATKEHPQDKADREASEAWAKTKIEAFCTKHRKSLIKLIQTYSDASANELLDSLRERFWGGIHLNDAELCVGSKPLIHDPIRGQVRQLLAALRPTGDKR